MSAAAIASLRHRLDAVKAEMQRASAAPTASSPPKEEGTSTVPALKSNFFATPLTEEPPAVPPKNPLATAKELRSPSPQQPPAPASQPSHPSTAQAQQQQAAPALRRSTSQTSEPSRGLEMKPKARSEPAAAAADPSLEYVMISSWELKALKEEVFRRKEEAALHKRDCDRMVVEVREQEVQLEQRESAMKLLCNTIDELSDRCESLERKNVEDVERVQKEWKEKCSRQSEDFLRRQRELEAAVAKGANDLHVTEQRRKQSEEETEVLRVKLALSLTEHQEQLEALRLKFQEQMTANVRPPSHWLASTTQTSPSPARPFTEDIVVAGRNAPPAALVAARRSPEVVGEVERLQGVVQELRRQLSESNEMMKAYLLLERRRALAQPERGTVFNPTGVVRPGASPQPPAASEAPTIHRFLSSPPPPPADPTRRLDARPTPSPTQPPPPPLLPGAGAPNEGGELLQSSINQYLERMAAGPSRASSESKPAPQSPPTQGLRSSSTAAAAPSAGRTLDGRSTVPSATADDMQYFHRYNTSVRRHEDLRPRVTSPPTAGYVTDPIGTMPAPSNRGAYGRHTDVF